MKAKNFILFAAICSVICPNTSVGGVPALSFTGGSVSSISTDTVVGWRFTANSNVFVDSLGMFDHLNDGFQTPSNVGLWDIGGTLLASTTVNSGDSLVNGFRYSTISPVPLSSGQDYVVAGTLDGDVDGDEYVSAANASTIPEITWVESRAVDTSVLTFPTEFHWQ